MSLFATYSLAAALLFFLDLSYAMFHRRSHGDLKELPGPKGYPLIGNLFDMPREKAFLKFKEWAEKYGPIFKIEFLGQTQVIVSNQTLAEDLLAKRGAIYSDRGTLHMIKLVTGG
ncbi:uncharacterized protein PV06_09365 [Exophiala oligosperma]|uniref:Cytochrome P450 n=2 Tax=Chaetothyriales TaxID=34395 RepID=A0A0D2DRP9_9EURO|nr:uncharacterized protein PV06_09365 [Exophiala oligosperma]KAJ9635318.1 hypothetical protein H2204_005879 [Knufia peltigerae]KIW38394.1 hypothetical protein PV06_09365 [Exophiala oligosperma]